MWVDTQIFAIITTKNSTFMRKKLQQLLRFAA